MSTALVALEHQLKPLAPHFSEVLANRMPVERLIRTVMLSAERLPKLLECDRQSLFNSAMSAAVLGLEVDGVTGQAFLIPFKNRAQLVIGYKGYSTLAARSGITITGAVVREGDAFDYDLAEGWISHKPILGNKGRIIAAWAKAAHANRPPVIVVLGIDELEAVKKRSPGATRSDSPWNDPSIGFPAMCEKTAKRRLARSLPLNSMQLAARMDEAVDEQGKSAWINPDRGVVIDGVASPIVEAEISPTPSYQQLVNPPPPHPSEPPAADKGASPSQPAPQLADEAPDLSDSERYQQLDRDLHTAALRGWATLKEKWEALQAADQDVLRAALNNRHKQTARDADKANART